MVIRGGRIIIDEGRDEMVRQSGNSSVTGMHETRDMRKERVHVMVDPISIEEQEIQPWESHRGREITRINRTIEDQGTID